MAVTYLENKIQSEQKKIHKNSHLEYAYHFTNFCISKLFLQMLEFVNLWGWSSSDSHGGNNYLFCG